MLVVSTVTGDTDVFLWPPVETLLNVTAPSIKQIPYDEGRQVSWR